MLVQCIDAKGSKGLLIEGAFYEVAFTGTGGAVVPRLPSGNESFSEIDKKRQWLILAPFYTAGLRELITWPYVWNARRFHYAGLQKDFPRSHIFSGPSFLEV